MAPNPAFCNLLAEKPGIEHIVKSLADPACRLLTLTGPGGIGKTRLAVASVRKMEAAFTDGVWFVPLAPVESARSLAPAIASSLDLHFSGPEDPTEMVIRFLRDKHLLLVLDNLEHLLQSVGFVSHILSSAPDVKILATSRERLSLQEEWMFPVEGLQYPQRPSDPPVESYSAVQLL